MKDLSDGPITEAEALRRILEYLDSHEWWALPVVNEATLALSHAIEKRYYMGDTNKDFHLLVHIKAGAMSAFVFALKKHMTAAQLCTILDEVAPAHADDRRGIIDGEIDILSTASAL